MESRAFLPSLHLRGTFHQVGLDVGRTFKAMIQEFVLQSTYLNEDLVPAYNSQRGQEIYKETMDIVNQKFPNYVRELQGIADGSEVPFFKLMLLHIDAGILVNEPGVDKPGVQSGNGCSSIICNREDVALCHTEDAFPAALNHCYIVHAHIIEMEGDKTVCEEKFSSLCYAGHLPGFCMNVNQHGFVYSINVVEPVRVLHNKTPRHFLTRALLSSRNLVDAQAILRDKGTGSAHGFCVNMAFLHQEGPTLFHSAEVGPAENGESQLSILTVSPGESHARCNKYLRLTNIAEDHEGLAVLSSNGRHQVFDKLGSPSTVADVIEMLSNQDDKDFPVFRLGTPKDAVVTIATGIFDCKRKEWTLYTSNPKTTKPIAVFPMEL